MSGSEQAARETSNDYGKLGGMIYSEENDTPVGGKMKKLALTFSDC